MAAELAQQLVDTTLGQCSAPRWFIVTALVVGAICLVFHLIRSYSPSNRLCLFERELEGVKKACGDFRDVLRECGEVDRIEEDIRR
jgi:hypothetical protein